VKDDESNQPQYYENGNDRPKNTYHSSFSFYLLATQ